MSRRSAAPNKFITTLTQGSQSLALGSLKVVEVSARSKCRRNRIARIEGLTSLCSFRRDRSATLDLKSLNFVRRLLSLRRSVARFHERLDKGCGYDSDWRARSGHSQYRVHSDAPSSLGKVTVMPKKTSRAEVNLPVPIQMIERRIALRQ